MNSIGDICCRINLFFVFEIAKIRPIIYNRLGANHEQAKCDNQKNTLWAVRL